MTNQDTSKGNKEGTVEGLPIQLKLLIAVIVIGIVAIFAKVIGIY